MEINDFVLNKDEEINLSFVTQYKTKELFTYLNTKTLEKSNIKELIPIHKLKTELCMNYLEGNLNLNI